MLPATPLMPIVPAGETGADAPIHQATTQQPPDHAGAAPRCLPRPVKRPHVPCPFTRTPHATLELQRPLTSCTNRLDVITFPAPQVTGALVALVAFLAIASSQVCLGPQPPPLQLLGAVACSPARPRRSDEPVSVY